MKIHKLNSPIATVLVGLTVLMFGFQNCTKARFNIDETVKQKTLDEGSVFGNTPGDDGQIAGSANNPGDDGSLPKFPGMGNDPSLPRMPGIGNDPMVPGTTTSTTLPPTTGNNPNMPRTPANGADPAAPSSVSSSITVTPNPVCAPNVNNGQASITAAKKIAAVLYKADNFAAGNFAAGNATVVQVWDTEPFISNIRAELAQMKTLSLKVPKPLTAGNYAVVFYDPSKITGSYIYDWRSLTNTSVVAPLADPMDRFIDTNSFFKVDSSGKQKSAQSLRIGSDLPVVCGIIVDPLLIQLKTSTPQPIALSAPEDGVMFDLLGNRLNHKKVQTAWFESSKTENYYLALPNKDGLVLGIDQLFGDATLGPDGKYASQGFAALAKYDDSGDKIISEDDEVFSQLRLWKDDNLDGIAQQSELYSLEEKGVVAIDLRFDERYSETDKHGNVTKYKSIVVMKDGQYGMVYDLFLRYLDN